MGKISCVYLAAGISSRFGGRIKALVRVGKNKETLLELSMQQAKDAGFNDFIIITNNSTLEPIKSIIGEDFMGIPVNYVVQEIPKNREKPFGTAQALLSVKDLVRWPFALLNSDDIYGSKIVKNLFDKINNEEGYYCPVHLLKNSIIPEGRVKRGIVVHENMLLKLIEGHEVSMNDVVNNIYNGEEFVSMNIFGLQPEFLAFLEKKVNEFIKNNNDQYAELTVVNVINSFIKENNEKFKVMVTDEVALGITNPED